MTNRPSHLVLAYALGCLALLVMLLAADVYGQDPDSDTIEIRRAQQRWEFTSFEAEGLDPSRFNLLKTRILDGTFKKINSIIVVKDGRILVEEYFNGKDRGTLHEIRSATKSIGSMLMGIAVGRGTPAGMHERLYEFFPDYAPFENWEERKTRITLQHVLDATTGFDSNDMTSEAKSRGHESHVLASTDLVRFMLDLPMVAEPGERWSYSTGTGHLIGPVIAQASGLSIQEFARRHLFEPLGITEYQWKVDQGWAHTGGGFRMRAIDMAKLGQLYLQNGRWGDQQVVPADWVRASAQRRIKVTEDIDHGYQWWKSSFLLDGQRLDTYFAAGNGGSHIFVFPDRNLVVAITGTAFGEIYDIPQIRMMMNKYVLPAIVQDSDPYRGEPILLRVPVIPLGVCGVLLASAFVAWPVGFAIRCVRVSRSRTVGQRRTPRYWLCILRLLASANVLIVLLFLTLILATEDTFELMLNSGYVRPLGPLELVIGRPLVVINMTITILTVLMTLLAFVSWRRAYWSKWERWHFSVTTAVTFTLVSMLWCSGLAWLP